MNTTDKADKKNDGRVNEKQETDTAAFVISHEEEDGLSVKIEAIPDTSDPATEGVGD